MLAALACVDYVVVFDEASVAGLVDRVQPDVLVKADQYTTEQVVGHESVLRRGGQVVSVPTQAALFDDRSDPADPEPSSRLANAVPRKVVSIIICTRDRAESLKETLRAIGESLRAGRPGRRGAGGRQRFAGPHAARRAAGEALGPVPRATSYEPRLGLSSARNSGMRRGPRRGLALDRRRRAARPQLDRGHVPADPRRPGRRRGWPDQAARVPGAALVAAVASGLPGGRCPADGRFRTDRRQHGFCPPRAGKGARLRSGTWPRGLGFLRRHALFAATSDRRIPHRRRGRGLDRRASLRRSTG